MMPWIVGKNEQILQPFSYKRLKKKRGFILEKINCQKMKRKKKSDMENEKIRSLTEEREAKSGWNVGNATNLFLMTILRCLEKNTIIFVYSKISKN